MDKPIYSVVSPTGKSLMNATDSKSDALRFARDCGEDCIVRKSLVVTEDIASFPIKPYQVRAKGFCPRDFKYMENALSYAEECLDNGSLHITIVQW